MDLGHHDLAEAAAALALACALVGCGSAPDEPARGRPVLWISIDTLAARRMSLHGHERATTPELERLAAGAVVFERCSSNAPWTTPSYMSQLTGLQAETFFEHPPDAFQEQFWGLAEDYTSLPEVFASAGCRTAAFVDNLHVGSGRGFGQGFEVFDESAARLGVDVREGGFEAASAGALAWLDGLDEQQPWLLFLQAADPHGPYLSAGKPEGPFESTDPVDDRELPIALRNLRGYGVVMEYIARPLVGEDATTAPLDLAVDAYDEGVAELDADLGAFFAVLEERGILDEAIVVLTADHGESLGGHGSFFDHAVLGGEVLHVPLVIWHPDLGAGRRVPEPVQLVDLFPTLVELTGVPHKGPLHGRSLVPAMDGAELEPRPILATGSFERARSVAIDGWKLIETRPSIRTSTVSGLLTSPRGRAWLAERLPHLAGKSYGTPELSTTDLVGLDLVALAAEAEAALAGPWYQLYDLETDPDETSDLAAAHPDRVEALRGLLERETERVRRDHLGPGLEAPMDEGTRELLEQMGYLGG